MARASRKRMPDTFLSAASERRFSQNGEDGIIAAIIDRVGAPDETFFEIGASDGVENCTRDLAERGWRGVWVEADRQKTEAAQQLVGHLPVEVVPRMVTRSNAAQLISQSSVPHPDVLVVDIDGNDWSVLCACLTTCRPRLIVIEYNSAIGPFVRWTMPYDDEHEWCGDRWHGVSYRFLRTAAPRFGYELVMCDPLGVNAFLVRRDLVARLRVSRPGAYVPPRYSVPFGHPWRSRRTNDCALDLPQFERIRISVRSVRRVDERVVVELDVENGSDSWLTSFGKHPFHVAVLRNGDRTPTRFSTRTKLIWPVPPRSHRPTAVTVDPDLFDGGVVEIGLLQEQVQWLTDLPGWEPLSIDVASRRVVDHASTSS
jgi:hypothetical protein